MMAMSRMSGVLVLLRSSWNLLFAAMLMLLALSMSGCNHNPPLPCEPLPPVSMPVTVSQPPKVSYSLQAQGLYKQWSQTLTNASATSPP